MKKNNSKSPKVFSPMMFCLLFLSISTPANSQQDRDIISTNEDYSIALISINNFLSENPRNCESSNINTANDRLTIISSRVMRYNDRARAAISRDSLVIASNALSVLDQIMPISVELTLRIADAYLKADCLNQADEKYRNVISIYTGNKFRSARERAMIGIDDVRSRRK